MLNESFFLASFDELKNVLFHQLTILRVAVVYILMYVIYKALGRYVYFKPQEHASKVNRTFLTLSLLIVFLHNINGLSAYLPFSPEYRWLYLLCALIIIISPFSIIMDRVIWKYENGRRTSRNWHYKYLPITKDYYKTTIAKTDREGSFISQWEEEGVESTRENIHSDALLHLLALLVFIAVNGKWAYDSVVNYGLLSFVFSLIICLTISGIFIDRAILSWISYLEKK